GIDAFGNVLVAGNVVTGAGGGTGIYLGTAYPANSSASASANVVYNNSIGIHEAGYGGTGQQNRVYNNSLGGLIVDFLASILENVIYSNLIGIQFTWNAGGRIANNLVYANFNQGVLIQSPNGSEIDLVNNTIYQPVGDGVDISQTANVHLRNNILWAFAGYDITVATDSQIGFASDYNDLL